MPTLTGSFGSMSECNFCKICNFEQNKQKNELRQGDRDWQRFSASRWYPRGEHLLLERKILCAT